MSRIRAPGVFPTASTISRITSTRRPPLKLGTVSMIFDKSSSRALDPSEGHPATVVDEPGRILLPLAEPPLRQDLPGRTTPGRHEPSQPVQERRGLTLPIQALRGDPVQIRADLQHRSASQAGFGPEPAGLAVKLETLLPGDVRDEIPGFPSSRGIIEDPLPERHLRHGQLGIGGVAAPNLQVVLETHLGEQGRQMKLEIIPGGVMPPKPRFQEFAERDPAEVDEGSVPNDEHRWNI